MPTTQKNVVPTIIAFLLALTTGLSLVVLNLVTTRVKNTASVNPTQTLAAAPVCTDTIAQVALSTCNQGCFVDLDCATGLKCIGAVGTTTAGKCRDANFPTSENCNQGVGDIINRVVSVGQSGTFSFTQSYPAGTTVMDPAATSFSATTVMNGTGDASLRGYYTENGGAGWLTAGTVVTTTAQQPPSGWCLTDVGTFGDNDALIRSGQACRNVSRVVKADDAQAAIFLYERCSVSNWANTNCTYNVQGGAVSSLSVLEMTVTNPGSTEATFSVTASGETSSTTTAQVFNPNVAGVTSKLVTDLSGTSIFKVPAGRTLKFDLDVHLRKITGISLDVQAGSVQVTNASIFDVATGAVKVNDATKKEFTVSTGKTPAATPVPTTSAGLSGVYFDNRDFTNQKLTRTDAKVNFDWAYRSPDSKLSSDTYSIRWSGKVTAPVDGEYTFFTQADDGTRLWVNGQQLVNDWTTHTTRERSGKIKLEAGKQYEIKLEYFEASGRSSVRLLWAFPGVSKQVVPTEALAL